MTSITIADLKEEDFLQWLNENGGREVGRTCDPTDCPICRWLKHKYGVETVIIGIYGLLIGEQVVVAGPLPKNWWLTRAIGEIDAIGYEGYSVKGREVYRVVGMVV
jgi:hypothetical protein